MKHNQGYVPCVCEGSVIMEETVCFVQNIGWVSHRALLIAFHDSVTQQNASRPNKACTYRELQTCPKFSQPDSRYSRLLIDVFKIPSAALDLRSNMWDCVSLKKKKKKAIEPGKSIATLHRKRRGKNSLNNELPAWKRGKWLPQLVFVFQQKITVYR